MRIVKNRRGFTLVEMMIVIAIIGILCAMAIPMWNHYRLNTDLRTATTNIAADIQNLKQRAVTEQTRYRIVFNTANHSYQIINFTTGDVVQTKQLSDFGVGITLTGTTFNNNTVNFLARGTTTWGRVNIKNSLESTASIIVNPAGRTHVEFEFK